MNIAKLTTIDLPLFNGIIQDLFPAVETPTIDYGKVVLFVPACIWAHTTLNLCVFVYALTHSY